MHAIAIAIASVFSSTTQIALLSKYAQGRGYY